MKPNPVKKTVEYCSASKNERCFYYSAKRDDHHIPWCLKHNRSLSGNGGKRPTWCTDETFVRVAIGPTEEDGIEYCVIDGCVCGLADMHRGDGYFCRAIKEHINSFKHERPDACRKLEVE